jgi:hypothetical protein
LGTTNVKCDLINSIKIKRKKKVEKVFTSMLAL